MKTTLKLEELAMFIASILLFNTTDFAWWYYPAFLLLPDVGMLGYVINSRVGAFSYNLFHHKGLALIILGSGYFFENSWMLFTGVILFGHASMDRVFGYGLKYETAFKDTHLGKLN